LQTSKIAMFDGDLAREGATRLLRRRPLTSAASFSAPAGWRGPALLFVLLTLRVHLSDDWQARQYRRRANEVAPCAVDKGAGLRSLSQLAHIDVASFANGASPKDPALSSTQERGFLCPMNRPGAARQIGRQPLQSRAGVNGFGPALFY